jgi:subtilase family serine protease
MLFLRSVRHVAKGLLLLLALQLTATQWLTAQSSTPATASDLSRSDLSGSEAGESDLGEADPARTLPALTLQFQLDGARQATLTQLLLDQQNPASPTFHRWLTPEQFRSRFGMTSAQADTASRWLAARGFTNIAPSRGGLFLRFSGTVAQTEQAFATSIHTFAQRGETHLAIITEPTMPAALGGFTAAVGGLDGFHPRTHGGILGATRKPAYTTASGIHYLAPGDFYTIYNEQTLLNNSVNGAGIGIAVIGQSDIYPADITAFQTAAGLTKVQPAVSTYGADPGYPSAADLNEAEADLEWAHAIAPGATVLYVNSTNAIQGSLTEAIDNNVAPIIATSYGACEASLGTNTLAYFNLLLQMASAEGITVVAATGDSGATDCDANVGNAVNGLAVDFPASSPQVLAVGGTEFAEGSGVYWSPSNSSTGSSATTYLPEIVWNDDNGAGLAASGGGPSAYFSKPSWQTGQGVPNDFSRDVPDIALAASINHDGYLICTGSACTNGFLNTSGGYEVYGGTSLATPAFAGLLALVEQKVGSRLGNAGPVIYALANSAYSANVFHDVVSGSNASPCTAGTPNCAGGGAIGFAATAGYDEATGWGSVNASNLVNSWSLVTSVRSTTGADPSSTTLAGSLTNAVAGMPINFSVAAVSGTTASTATPTGSVQITIDSVPIGSAITLTSGAATYVLNTTSIAAGKHTVQATYTGDNTFSGSKGAFNVTITAAGGPDFALTPATASVTVASGSIAPSVVFTVSPLGGFTGNVSFTASLAAPLAAQYSFTNNPVTITSASSGSTSFALLAYTYKAGLVVGPMPSKASRHTARQTTPPPNSWSRTGTGVVLAGILLLFLPGRRRLPMLVVMAVVALGVTGCGPAAAPPTASSITGTATGTYSVLIQATATINGAIVEHTSTITYTVQ